MPDLVQIARALDYIEDHLQEAITVADMAEAVSYSLWHFCRTFNQATHHTPYDYLMRRRLAEAARALVEGDEKIIEVALDYQFNNPETFSRAFRRVFGLQPSRWRKEGRAGHWHQGRPYPGAMPALTLAHLEQIDKGPYLRPVVEAREAMQLGGVMGPVPGEASAARGAIGELWDLLARELGRLGEVTPRGPCYGLVCHPEGREPGGALYLAAVELPAPPGEADLALASSVLVFKTIPAGSWARFVHKGRRRDLPLTMDYVYHTWLPRSGRSLTLPWVVEGYGRDLPAAEDNAAETAIYIPIE